MAACYSGGPGFKSRKERELLNLNKKEYTQIHMLIWLQKAMLISRTDGLVQDIQCYAIHYILFIIFNRDLLIFVSKASNITL